MKCLEARDRTPLHDYCPGIGSIQHIDTADSLSLDIEVGLRLRYVSFMSTWALNLDVVKFGGFGVVGRFFCSLLGTSTMMDDIQTIAFYFIVCRNPVLN